MAKISTKSQKKNRSPLQPAGMPQGKHLTGFKGTKADEECFCGGCHPNAKANAKRARVIQL
jgi:hypothetical protein